MFDLIILLFVGYLIRNYIDSKTLFNILFYLVLPSAIILQFSQLELSLDLILFPLFYIISGLIMLHTFEFLGRSLGFDKTQIGTAIITMPIINAGALYSLSYYLFGAEGLLKATIYTIGYVILIPYAILRASEYSIHHSNREDLIVGQTLKSPLIISMIIAILMNYIDIKIDGILRDIMGKLVDMLVPLSMISIGSTISLSTTLNRFIIFTMIIRTIVPIMILLILYMNDVLNLTDLKLLLLASLTPLGFFGPMISSKIGLNLELSSNLVFVSIIMFLVAFIWI